MEDGAVVEHDEIAGSPVVDVPLAALDDAGLEVFEKVATFCVGETDEGPRMITEENASAAG